MKTNNAVRHNVHVKKGDKVVIISGKDKGKIGEVKEVFTKSGKVLVEATNAGDDAKINLITKATKASATNTRGGLIKREAPIQSSKVMPYDESLKKGVRLTKKVLENGTKVRISKKSNEQFD
ncbi:MAG: 50S ribosomal protein L24 [Candidatus Sericytochromatia bacterium]|nr:50S ribosomal protein L24 [Candidatus Sericytochromatia bacterium]